MVTDPRELDAIDYHDDLDNDVDNLDDELSNSIYDIGYNSGYVDGFKEGQTHLALDTENLIYNNTLSELIEFIEQFDFDYKSDLLQAISALRKT